MGRRKSNAYTHFVEAQGSYLCKYCSGKYQNRNATRLRNHLLNCAKIPADVLKNLKSEPFMEGSSTSTEHQIIIHPKSMKSLKPLTHNTKEREITNQLCRAMFRSGTPFSIVEHPEWIKLFKVLRPLYKLPSKDDISQHYLDREYENVKAHIQQSVLNGAVLHIQVDGWSNFDSGNSYVLSVVTSTGHQVFEKLIKVDTAHSVCAKLALGIQELLELYGCSNFYSLIGDNCDIVQTSFAMISKQYDHLMTASCSAHTLFLLAGDIITCESVNNLLQKALDVVNLLHESSIFLLNNSETLETLKNWKSTSNIPNEKYCLSHLNFVKLFFSYKKILQQLARGPRAPALFNTSSKKTIKTSLIDEEFWRNLDIIMQILAQIVEWLIKLEDFTVVHLVFSMFQEAEEKVMPLLMDSFLTAGEIAEINSNFVSRKKEALKNVHFAAALLDPCTQGSALSPVDQLDATEFIDVTAQKIRDINESEVLRELTMYRAKTGIWERPILWRTARDVTPLQWWKAMSPNPDLQLIASCILSVPCSSTARRNFKPICNPGENDLAPEMQKKLTYVEYNQHLISDDASEELVNEEVNTTVSVMKFEMNDEEVEEASVLVEKRSE